MSRFKMKNRFINNIFISIIGMSQFNLAITESGMIDNHNNPDIYNTYCMLNLDCLGINQICDSFTNRCVCQPYYEYYFTSDNCLPCPTEGRYCTKCCISGKFECIDNVCTRCYTDDGAYICDSNTVIFVTASQIALTAALVMGVAALAMLLYRVCTRPSYFAGQPNRVTDDLPTHSGSQTNESLPRASLTSIQVRVLAQLRDRPPRYESQHNFDSRRQQEHEDEQPSGTQTTNSEENSDVIMNQNIHAEICIANVAPPSYDGARQSITEHPPSYMETINQSVTDSPINVINDRGFVNQAYVSNDEETVNVIRVDTDSSRSKITENMYKDNKTIHI